MKEIHVVTKGSYSDYHIIALFSDKSKAEGYTKLINGSGEDEDEDGAKVESFPLDNLDFNAESKWFEVAFNNAKEVVKVCEGDAEQVAYGVDKVNGVQTGERYLVTIFAKTTEGAIKIAKEKLMIYLEQKSREE